MEIIKMFANKYWTDTEYFEETKEIDKNLEQAISSLIWVSPTLRSEKKGNIRIKIPNKCEDDDDDVHTSKENPHSDSKKSDNIKSYAKELDNFEDDIQDTLILMSHLLTMSLFPTLIQKIFVMKSPYKRKQRHNLNAFHNILFYRLVLHLTIFSKKMMNSEKLILKISIAKRKEETVSEKDNNNK
ncbi:hypothetical protein CEXT_224911 [Caerostris extrusa]|uniref:Uncharacterized protein n=1 Tax=Caerostris extrusa TaxID=172846 RepID=A0AAV4XZ36_CAEEX|nr:hypothetical protein CEXT_224911 [Caerostris extrusa]